MPVPKIAPSPPEDCRGPSGTLVVWQQCDRLDNRRISTLERKLASELGRRFRHFIWRGVKILLNGTAIRGVDPLYLRDQGKAVGAESFGDVLKYEIAVDPLDSGKGTGTIEVRFSELPVHE